MSYGLYKAGQGYWVRVLAASMCGIILLAACAWSWNELEKVAGLLPKPRVTLILAPTVTGAATPGQVLSLRGDADADGKPVEVATAVAKTWTPTSQGGATLVVEKLRLGAGHDLTQVKSVGAADLAAPLAGTVSGTPQGEDLFPPLYLQGAGVGLLMILGVALTWWLVGIRQPTVEFLIATDGEMKKVNWSTRKDVTASTWVVVMWSVLLAGGLFGIDFLFSQFFKLIGVLQS